MIDTSPDFRLQAADAGLKRIDAVLYTHDHADQTHGIDDLRVFALNMRRRIRCHMDAATRAGLTRRFDYIFEGYGGYPAICEAVDLPPLGQDFEIDGPSGVIPVSTFDLDHGGVRSVGYRVGNVAYCSDVVAIPKASMAAMQGLDVLIVDALRDMPHPTHAHVGLALDWIAALKPRRAILTNLHIDLDYTELAARLPAGVEPAYDGLTFESEL